MKITFNLELFADRHPKRVRISSTGRRQVLGLNRKDSERALLWLLESLVQVNIIELRKNKLPPLYKAGVRYEREIDTEIWRDVVTVYDDGFGDCEDLACWRVAELRNQGKKASARLSWRKQGDMLIYHVTVLRANGRIEDPSVKLGMRGPDGY